MRTRLRSAIVIAGLLLVTGSFLREVNSAFETGLVELGFGRRGPIFSFDVEENPFGYWATLTFYLMLASALGWAVWRMTLGLVTSKATDGRWLLDEQLKAYERIAPSGLRPLWIGLLIAGIGFAWFVLRD